MDAGIEKECSALGGLFQLIMNDMKASYPTWEDFVTKGAKLQSQLRTTILVTGSFLDAFQKVADMATGTRGATKEIGSALTRMCMRHRSIESKLKLFTTALSESLITPLELKMEEWKKVASQLDKDHAKEYKKARAEIKKKSSDTIKLQKKVKKGKDEVRGQLDSALQDVNVRYAVLEETEKRAVCRALVEERARYCSFVSMLKPVLDHEINMLGEVTHLQTILEDLTTLTAEPNKLPPASEQVILDLKGSDFSYLYQTPPASPSNTLSRKSSVSSNYQSGSVRHVPSLDSISCTVDGLHMQRCSSPFLLIGCEESRRSLSEGHSPSRRGRSVHATVHVQCHPPGRRISRRDWTTDGMGSTGQMAAVATGENGQLPLLHPPYTRPGERVRAMSASSKSCSAREQLALTLGSDAQRSSRDSLHCSSGYSTQTTTPSCSEDTIHTHLDYESVSLQGDVDSVSLHQLSLGCSQSDLDKSSTIPRNSDLSLQYRRFAQSKRPSSTVSLLAEPELGGASVRNLASHTATIRRKPLTKPAYRRGTISGGVPIPISTPQVPLKVGNTGSEENMFIAPSGGGGLGYSKLCTSTQSLSALPPSTSPYYQLVPGHMPIPVSVPTVPSLPPTGATQRQQQEQHLQLQHEQQMQYRRQQLQQSNPRVDHHLLQRQQSNPRVDHHLLQQQQSNQHLDHHLLQQQQSIPHQDHHHHLQQQQSHPHVYQRPDDLNQKQKLFQPQQVHLQSGTEAFLSGHVPQLDPPPPSIQVPEPEVEQQRGEGDMLTLIRKVKLKRTVTDDRSAPLLPPAANHQ
ncbi:protein MTSS 1 isoform X1 [Synchiropus splendidus]|uniref:protein MTSS 1 isoform X1 n=1 Tax=Synchiropus splendidus TaxID=270530 RepID=UPI00237DFB96|nr:protein MTSS 1 isoform X1 [Synchiropus splendidus]